MEKPTNKPPETEISILKNLMLNEYVGNLLIPRFKSCRLGRLYRHDKLSEVENLNPRHPIIKKLEKKFANFIIDTWDVVPSPNNNSPNIYCPTKTKILQGLKITSKNIRTLDILPQNIIPKMLTDTTIDGLTKLSNRIAKMANTKLQTIALRSIHGDIYSKYRMKKFGMVEQDNCERCGKSETIEHHLLECDYVKSIWSLTSKLTSIPTLDLNTVLGYHDYHDITTLTVHCEIIRRLLAIERPTQNPHKMIKSVITRLGVVEKGISKIALKNMLTELDKITQSTTVLSLAASSSLDPDSEPDTSTSISSTTA